jgi:hypothetical protein
MAWRKDCSRGLQHEHEDIFSIKIGRLSTNIKLTLYKALIRSVMTHACPTWKYAADAHLLKLQRLQNRVLRATGNLDRCTPVRKLHVAFKIPYVYEYITTLCRAQAEVILNHINPQVRARCVASGRTQQKTPFLTVLYRGVTCSLQRKHF